MKVLANSERLRNYKVYLSVWFKLLRVRIRLSISGYAYYKALPERVRSAQTRIRPAGIALIVKRVSRFVPGAKCLAQAITAQNLLAKHGYETTMRIGVRSESSTHLAAHAWLIYKNDIILGGSAADLDRYEVLTNIRSANS